MEDKIIDDLDVDFMREILGPADLQIGDNLVRDIMTEYNNTCNNLDSLSGQTWNVGGGGGSIHLQPASMSSAGGSSGGGGGQDHTFIIQSGTQIHTNQHQFFTDNNNPMNHHHQHQQHSQIVVNNMPPNGVNNGGYVMQPVEFNTQSTGYTTLDFSIQPGAQMMLANNHHQILPSNSPPVLQSMQQSFNTNNINPGSFQPNTSMLLTQPPAAQIHFDSATNNQRRVRKNLKDILKEKDSILNTSTMMLNQQDQNMFAPMHHIQPQQIIVHQSQSQHFNQVEDPNMNNELYRIASNPTPSPIKLMMPSSTPPLASVQKVPNSPPSLASLSSSTMMANDLKSQSPSFVIPAATVSTLAEKPVSSKQSKSKAENNNKSKAKSSASKENVSLSAASGGPPLTAKRNKVSKRTSHNAIEKKYRSSINDKINELKNRVAGPNVKLQKSGILRKALEHLNMVDDTIKNLRTENGSYRSALNAIRLQLNSAQTETLILQNIQNIVNSIPAEFHTKQYPNVLTPPGSSSPVASMSDYSQFSSGENSNSSSSDSFSSSGSPAARESPSSLDSTGSSHLQRYKKMKKEPMSDASRVFLCMFVMSVLFFNPFNLMFDSSTSSVNSNGEHMETGQHLNSRVLNWFRTSSESIDNATMSNNLASSSSYFTTQALISWSLNIVLVVFCLLRLYLKSEPVIERDLSIEKIWLVYQKASKSFQRRMYDESFGWIEKGLNELGHSVPRTKWQLMFGIVWQLTRVGLNSFFTRLAAMNIWWTKSSKNNEEKRLQVFKVYKLSALFYYEASKFGYLNMHSEKDFTPRTTLDEDNKAETKSDSNGSASSGINNLRLTITPYSYLMSIYFMLANYNMCEIYTLEHHKSDMTVRDEYNLCEYYMHTSLYLSLFLPSRLSRSIIKYMMKKKLSQKLKKFDNDEEETTTTGSEEKQACKWRKLRALLRKSLFLNYLINFDIYSNLNSQSGGQSDQDRLKVLNLLSFKRRVFKSTESFLYSVDDSVSYLDGKQSCSVRGDYGVAISFIVAKFQDFLLYKMTGHILAAQSQMIRSERILKRRGYGKPLIDAVDAVSAGSSTPAQINSSRRSRKLDDLDEQQKEQADVDQIKFERVMNLYKKNVDSSTISPQQETHLLLVEFLIMLNNWKLRNFDARTSGYIRDKLFEKKAENSPFVEAIRNVLRAHECIASDRPSDESLKYCRDAVNSLKAFDHSFNAYSPNYYLIEKFELLIYDWILSAQTHVWTEQKKFDLELYNECLSKYQDLVVNLFPNLSSKVKMYQTVMLCLTNRNPISLLNATSKQSTFAKCNQEALFSINNILKNFHLHLVE